MKRWIGRSENSGSDRGTWLLIALCLGLSAWAIFSSVAGAQPCPPKNGRSEILVLEGAPGRWFSRASARCLLLYAEQRPLHLQTIEGFKEEIRLRDDQEAAISEALYLQTERANGLEKDLNEVGKKLDKLDRTWRHPAIWLCVGLVVGGVGTGVAVGLSR